MVRTLSVEEAASMFNDYHLSMVQPTIRRWLYLGRIKGKLKVNLWENPKIEWEIPEYEILRLIAEPPTEYMTAEYNQNDPQMFEVYRKLCLELKEKNNKLEQENVELRGYTLILNRKIHDLKALLGVTWS